jgi:TonB family protein
MANIQPEIDRARPVASRSDDVSVPIPSQRELAFKTFGPMDTGQQTKSSVVTSLVLNGVAVLVVLLVTVTAKKVIQAEKPMQSISFVAPPVQPPPPPPKLPKPPVIKTPPPEPPKVKLPTVEVPNPPKIQPVIMKPAPTPVITPPAPKAVVAPPAPKPIPLHIAVAASVPNHDEHPSPVRLGNLTNPINNTTGPAVSPVNLGHSGAPGMPAGNTGYGPPSKIALAGSGSPNGSNMAGHDNAAQPIKGIGSGVPGGTGPMNARSAGAIAIAKNNPPPTPITTQASSTTPPKAPPKVLFKPRPDYTEEARQMHLEGTVKVKIHVSAAGSVSVLGVQEGLGHGLDQAAVRAVQGMRFQPAVQNGQPTDWDGVVSIAFQLAS